MAAYSLQGFHEAQSPLDVTPDGHQAVLSHKLAVPGTRV